MKALPTIFSLVLISAVNTTLISAQEIWDGPTILFSKAAFANWTEPENQDRITENVWITRADSRGIFNFFLEESYINDLSPQDTEWAFGTTQEIEKLSFTDWETAVNENPPGSIDQPMVVHLISEDIYIDLVFRSWGQGGGSGGSFSYERSSDPSLGFESAPTKRPTLYPNPANDHIKVRGVEPGQFVEIYSVLGVAVGRFQVSEDPFTLNLDPYPSGIYMIRLGPGQIQRLVIN
jgi:hypothetical protein